MKNLTVLICLLMLVPCASALADEVVEIDTLVVIGRTAGAPIGLGRPPWRRRWRVRGSA